MPRAWIWFQIVSGWVPMWALYTAMVAAMHPGTPFGTAGLLAARAIIPAAVLGLPVYRLSKHAPWPRAIRPRFVLVHIGAALAYAGAWMSATVFIEYIARGGGRLAIVPGMLPFLVLGVWLYVLVAGVSYTVEATSRASRAEAAVVRIQLETLRAQLHPHFLFNALHAIVHLIPTDPARAQEAAEELSGLLRIATEEHRDVVSLEEEWRFVERYLAIERIRFGDRLRVRTALQPEALLAHVPAFALQTLVENAVRHGAAPRVESTQIDIRAQLHATMLTLQVCDDGMGGSVSDTAGGTGLNRLRERLGAIYGNAGAMNVVAHDHGGWSVTLTFPADLEDHS